VSSRLRPSPDRRAAGAVRRCDRGVSYATAASKGTTSPPDSFAAGRGTPPVAQRPRRCCVSRLRLPRSGSEAVPRRRSSGPSRGSRRRAAPAGPRPRCGRSQPRPSWTADRREPERR
jgi:hypothetical protein